MRATRDPQARHPADPPVPVRAIIGGFLALTISPYLYLLPYLFGFDRSPAATAAGLVITWITATSGFTAITAGILDLRAPDGED